MLSRWTGFRPSTKQLRPPQTANHSDLHSRMASLILGMRFSPKKTFDFFEIWRKLKCKVLPFGPLRFFRSQIGSNSM